MNKSKRGCTISFPRRPSNTTESHFQRKFAVNPFEPHAAQTIQVGKFYFCINGFPDPAPNNKSSNNAKIQFMKNALFARFSRQKKEIYFSHRMGDNQYETQRKTIYCTQNSVTISIGDRCRSVVSSLKKNWKDDLGTTVPYVLKSSNLRRTKIALILSWYSRISSIQLE